ncbi:DUF2865 domain-containing protein [Microvirga subterranea]|uniref:Uncharacterized protein DUF2865 n=1 Tax=Microvirga subterranea TaxID=186651 RepID=A0A370HR09_9HYPH|nr:DUF2865 domain-containing protein [Microvirga subterranea]RDI60982.1 uncharacterized protein DUF2865 [Microvirga subterranea]
MTKTPFFRTLIAAAAFLVTGGVAVAQSPECQRFRAELAALDRGAGPQTAAMQTQRNELNRLLRYYRSIGCERGPLGFLAGPPPAECPTIAGQIRQMEAGYARLAQQAADSGEVEFRRRQLQAAVQQTCSTEQPRGFFESLFGPPRGQPQPSEIMPEGQPIIADEQQSLGGGKLVCVKSCDGSFFPLSNSPGGRQGAEEMCQALCPGTETHAYAYPGGDNGLSRAVSVSSNQPYTSLANAFKFRKSFDESCACKRENESWAVVLRRAEGMLEQRKGDVIVTAEKSEELSRPKQAQAKKAADKKADEETQQAAEVAASAPTASKESAGIGPQSIENATVVNQGEGAKQEVTARDGTKRTIRVIAPNVVPVPNARN